MKCEVGHMCSVDASHHALRANYIINSRPPVISALDNRRHESRKFSSECSVQQRLISQRIFICLPAVFLLLCFYHQSMLIKRLRSQQSYRPRKETGNRTIISNIITNRLACILEKYQQENT